MGQVYLIHLDNKLSHAQHYIGYAENDLNARLRKHGTSSGARMLQAARENDIVFSVVRVWENVDRAFERKLKNQKNAPRFCPICGGKGNG